MGNYEREGLYSSVAPLHREISVVVIGWQMAEAVGSRVYPIH